MNKMVESQAAWLQTLPSLERARFLAWVIHELTIAGRVLAHSNSSAGARFEQLRQLTEMQHRIASYIGHALGTDEDPGWLTIVASSVFEPADKELKVHTAYAWSQTRRRFTHVL